LIDPVIQQIVLYFARVEEQSFEVQNVSLKFKEYRSTDFVDGSANSVDGIISTRRGNATSWLVMMFIKDKKPDGSPGPNDGNPASPTGTWELTLPKEIGDLLKPDKNGHEQIEDILFVITYAARTPAWPAS
jgi:hypothetical protein